MNILTQYPPIKISQLHIFVLIAQTGNFMKTAKILGLSQPAVSSSIKQLESIMNAKLFHRTTKHIELTTIGEDILPYAQRLIENYAQTLGTLHTKKQSLEGSVNIAVLPSIANTFLPYILSEYMEKYPLVKINIVDTTSAGLFQKVMRKEVDFSVGNLLSLSNEILFEPILEDKLNLVCHANNPIAQQPDKHTWDIILKMPNFMGNGLESLMAYEGVQVPEHRLFLRNITMLTNLIKQDIGITALPNLLSETFDDNILHIPINQPIVKRTIGIFQLKSRFMSTRVQTLIDMVKNVLSKKKTTY